MLHRRILCTVAFLALGHIQAQTTMSPPPQGADSFDNILRVTRVTIKTPRATLPNTPVPCVDVEVQRLSDKAISAFGLDLSMKYADGSESNTSVATDFIRSLVPEVPGFTVDYPGLTRPGEFHTGTFYAQSDHAGLPPVAVSAKVTWVAFDDGSVSGSSKAPGLQVILESRKKESRYLKDLIKELRAVVARPDVSAALSGSNSGSGQQVLKSAVRNLKSTNDVQTEFSARRNHDLDNAATAAAIGKDKFDALLSRFDVLQTLIADQSNLKEDK